MREGATYLPISNLGQKAPLGVLSVIGTFGLWDKATTLKPLVGNLARVVTVTYPQREYYTLNTYKIK